METERQTGSVECEKTETESETQKCPSLDFRSPQTDLCTPTPLRRIAQKHARAHAHAYAHAHAGCATRNQGAQRFDQSSPRNCTTGPVDDVVG
jgi:hypothetical protein